MPPINKTYGEVACIGFWSSLLWKKIKTVKIPKNDWEFRVFNQISGTIGGDKITKNEDITL